MRYGRAVRALVASAGSAASVVDPDTIGAGPTGQAAARTRSAAGIEVAVRVPASGGTELVLEGGFVLRGGAAPRSGDARRARRGLVRVCRARYEAPPAAWPTRRLRRVSEPPQAVLRTVPW